MARQPTVKCSIMLAVLLVSIIPVVAAPIHDAVAQGNISRVKALLRGNAKLASAMNKDGNTPLHLAALTGNTRIMDILLARSVSVNVKNKTSWTPLYIAALMGHTSAAKLLLEKGADANTSTGAGDTPLTTTMGMKRRTSMARLLISHGATIAAGHLFTAVNSEDIEMAGLLLYKGVDVNAREQAPANLARTPLHIAAGRGNLQLVKLLLEHGADTRATVSFIKDMPLKISTSKTRLPSFSRGRSSSGYTALDVAESEGYTKVAELLQEWSAKRQETSEATGASAQPVATSEDTMDAVKTGDVAGLREKLEADASLANARDEAGSSPLHWAVDKERNEIIEILLSKGADPSARKYNGVTPLHVAAALDRMEIARLLFKSGAEVNAIDDLWRTPLDVAKTATMRRLLRSAGALSAQAAADSALAVFGAIEKADVERVRRLIKGNRTLASARVRDLDAAPLFFAAGKGVTAIVDLLIRSGCSLDVREGTGRSPLHFAVFQGHADVVRALLQAGSKANAEDVRGMTPLHFAAQLANKSIAELLIKGGATVDSKDGQGATALHYAVAEGQNDLVDLLVSKGANIDLKEGRAGFTPLHVAASGRDIRMVELLVHRKANLHAQSDQGSTPLHIAAVEGFKDIVQSLVANGASAHMKDYSGYTPLQLARKAGHKEVATILEAQIINTVSPSPPPSLLPPPPPPPPSPNSGTAVPTR